MNIQAIPVKEVKTECSTEKQITVKDKQKIIKKLIIEKFPQFKKRNILIKVCFLWDNFFRVNIWKSFSNPEMSICQENKIVNSYFIELKNNQIFIKK